MKQSSTPNVAVVCGGPAAERTVSLESGKCVAQALRSVHIEATIFELNERIGEELRAANVNVVFPALHGPLGEDGSFQGLLEVLGLPYVGSGVAASACAMDKVLAKRLFRSFGLPVAREVILHYSEEPTQAAKRVVDDLGENVVLKPSNQGSGLGVLFASSVAEVEDALTQTFMCSKNVLVEEHIEGREITAGVLERDTIEALPVIEIRTPSGTWYDYQHRYTPHLSEHIIPASLSASQYTRVQEIAKLAHQALGCRDLSRADFIVSKDGEPVLLEVNTLPGMTPTSLYPDAARAANISFEELVKHFIQRALFRNEK
jgi:D-alanine-D-alanine ligase